jgi:sulfatase maturation enzyme AslB (radical SAM superfamily)
MFNKKVLCLGSNFESTNDMVEQLAKEKHTENFGLVHDENFVPVHDGFYHTTITDLPFGKIVALAKQFDSIVMLDQPRDQWDHWRSLVSTYKIMVELESQGCDVTYKDNKNIQAFSNFSEYVKTNKSFCIYPWISHCESTGNGALSICARSTSVVTSLDKLTDWQTDPDFSKIRQRMIDGEKLPEHCKICYDYEDKGVESYRQYETKDWITKLGITSLEDLDKIDSPKFYDLRLSNKCNLMCRSCKPEFSHLIDRENRQHKTYTIVAKKEKFKYTDTDVINIDKLDSDCQVYLTGGEPTVMTGVYTFMKNCITKGKTNFDYTLGTNGMKFSEKFLELSSHFPNMNFSISLDGYGKVNDYWRWGSDWDTIIANTKKLQALGHSISINTVPGIYNITNLHLLYEFLDKEFPNTTVYLQLNYYPFQSPWHHPNAELILESLERCKKTSMYYSDGKSNKTMIDRLYDYYSKKPEVNLALLKEFFEFNDKVDAVRGSLLKDYIPELEECRKYID